jgi:hypothetical protein
MSTINGNSFSSPKNINLKGGILRFGATKTSNPLGTTHNGLYVNSSNQLIFVAQGTSTILGAAGSGTSVPSLDAILQNDQNLDLVALASFTIDRSSGNNDVLTLTNTGAGSGDTLQITNVGTGKDINGTNATWSFSKTGVNVMKSTTIAGTAGSDSITLTAGDMVMSDGSLTITDADNAATLSITNDTATSASAFVFAGSGTFTGSTTTSFMTITPSGLTTGTAVYLPLAALTTGTGLHVVANAITSGKALHIASSVGGTTMTANGRLLFVEHTGTAGNSIGALAEVISAATDETIIAKFTASAALALGNIVKISGSSMTTGTGLAMSDLDAMTTGIGLHVASSATAIATTGRLVYVNHTGATSTSGILTEFISSATDETTIVKITSAAMVDGVNLLLEGTTGMTTGSLLRASTSTAGIVATNGIISLRATGAYTSTSNAGLLDVQASALVGTGTVVNIKATNGSQLTNTLLNVEQTTTTTGYTGSIVSITGTSTTGAANVVLITSANSTAGNALKIITGATTTNGRGILLQANELTTGVGFAIAHTTSVIADGGSLVRLSSSSVDTGGATNGTILDIANTGSVVGTLVKMYSNVASQTATTILDIAQAGATLTAFTDDVVAITGGFSGNSSTGSVLTVTGVNTTAGNTVKVDASAITTGTGLLVTSAGVIITTGELVSLVANGATTSTGVLRLSATSLTDGWCAQFTGGGAGFTASGGMIDLAMGAATVGTGIKVVTTGAYTGTTGLLALTANSATEGVIAAISATSLTTGAALKITTNTTATGEYINCYDGAAVDFKVSRYGAVTIAGNAAGTAALTLTTGDIVLSGGNINVSNKFITSGIETIAGGTPSTALDLAKFIHNVDADAGGDIYTLADGIIGQITVVTMVSATGVATVTPTNLAGGTSVTLNAAGDSVMLQFVDTQWYIIGGNGYSVI